MNDELRFYLTASYGIAALWMLTYLGGFWVCLANRRLSWRLNVVAVGFAGLFASVGLERIALLDLDYSTYAIFTSHLLASAFGCVSSIVLVFGLGATLVDLRRQLSRALDPAYARR